MKTKKPIIAVCSIFLLSVSFSSIALTEAEIEKGRELDRRQNMSKVYGYIPKTAEQKKAEKKAQDEKDMKINNYAEAFIDYFKANPKREEVLLSGLTDREKHEVKQLIHNRTRKVIGESYFKHINYFVRDFRDEARLKVLLSGLNAKEIKLAKDIIDSDIKL